MTKTLSEFLESIAEQEQYIMTYGHSALSECNGAMYRVDLLLIGICKRTIAHCSGFRTMIKQNNFICAASMLRMQLDTALRAFGLGMVDDPEDFAKHLLQGGRYDTYKDSAGNQLRDRYLVKEVAKQFSWVESVYKETSDFVHLSERHLFTAIGSIDEDNQIVNFDVSAQDPNKGDDQYVEAAHAFRAVTGIILGILSDWRDQRRDV